MKNESKHFTKEEIKTQWIEHVKRWNKETFGEEECLGCKNNASLASIQKYLTQSIEDYLGHKNFPVKASYSSQGMSEFQKLIYLIEETEKILFEDGYRVMMSIIFDAYNIKHGIKGVLEILNHFVIWNEIE